MNEFTKPYFDAVAQLMAPTAPFEIETVEVWCTAQSLQKRRDKLGTFLAAGRNHGDALFLQYQTGLGPTQISLVPSIKSAIG